MKHHPLTRLPAFLGTVIVAATVALLPAPAVGRSIAPDMPAAMPGMHHHAQAAGQVAAPVQAPTAAVTMGDNTFDPKSISVVAGTTVTWTNRGARPHTVTGTGFDSGSMAAGASFSFTFSAPGTYAYVCNFHSEMTGTVVVTAPSAATPAPAAGVPTRPPASAGVPAPLPSTSTQDRDDVSTWVFGLSLAAFTLLAMLVRARDRRTNTSPKV